MGADVNVEIAETKVPRDNDSSVTSPSNSKMKTLLVFCVFAAAPFSIYAAPEGYYKQEYQFKKSSATYKNNQLETKNADEGYYGKQGDLTGSTAPQVEQHNQHSEFISPAVDGLGHSLTTYNDRDLTPEAERVFRDHNLNIGSNRQYSHSSSSSNFQGHGSQHMPTYSQTSNLDKITQNVQYDLEQQLREAVRSIHSQSAYSTQMRSEDMQHLENQLRANITRNLQDALKNQYGQQTTRGQASYSVISGGYNPVANYDTNELRDLQQRMEADLMKALQENARSTYSQSSSSSSSSYHGSYGTSGGRGYHRDSAEIEDLNRHGSRSPATPVSSSYRPYRPTTYPDDGLQHPERISYGQQPVASSHSSYGSSYGTSRNSYATNYDRDFPTLSQSQITVNPSKSVTDVMQTVQNDVTQQVRNAIKTYQARYASSSYTLTNSRPDFQVALNDLKRELRYNLTRKIQDELEQTYGRQDTRGEYSFSANSRNNANYRTADLDDLKQQVETNLINYLETSFRTYETNYQQSRTQYTNSQRDYTHNGPQYTQSLTSDTAQNPSHVRYEAGPYPGRTAYSSQSSYSASSSFGSGGAGDTQQLTQLQDDLTRSLQEQMHRQSSNSAYSSHSASSQGSSFKQVASHISTDDDMGQQTIDEDLESLVQKTDDFDTIPDMPLQSQSQSKPVRGDLAEPTTHQTGNSFGRIEFGRTTNSQAEVGQQTEDIGQQMEDLERLSQQPDHDHFDGYGKLEVGNQHVPVIGQQTEDDVGELELGKPMQAELGNQNTLEQEIGQQTEDGQIETSYFQTPLVDSTMSQMELGNSHNNHNLSVGNQLTGQQTENESRRPIPSYPAQNQQSADDDYEDDIILGVKPLSPTTTTTEKSTTPYETYGVYRSRHSSNRYHRPQYTFTTTTEKMSVFNQQQQIDDFASQLAETQLVQDGFNNEFIDHGDYLQHKPQVDQVDNPRLPSVADDASTSNQQIQEPEDLDKLFKNPEDDSHSGYVPAISLSSVHGAYINQNQYAYAPQFNPHSQSRRIPAFPSQQEQRTSINFRRPLNRQQKPVDNSMETGQQPMSEDFHDFQEPVPYVPLYQHQGNSYSRHTPQKPVAQEDTSMDVGQHPLSEDFQQQFDPEPMLYVPSYQQQGRSYSSYASPAQEEMSQDNQDFDSTHATKQETDGDEHKDNTEEKCDSSEGVEEEEAVTEVVKPLGFWQKVGGKITSGFNTVKQKAKSLVGSSST